jgi:hypothetical protein
MEWVTIETVCGRMGSPYDGAGRNVARAGGLRFGTHLAHGLAGWQLRCGGAVAGALFARRLCVHPNSADTAPFAGGAGQTSLARWSGYPPSVMCGQFFPQAVDELH